VFCGQTIGHNGYELKMGRGGKIKIIIIIIIIIIIGKTGKNVQIPRD